LHGWTAAIHQSLEGYLRAAGVPDPATEAAVLFALIDGVCQHYGWDPERYPLEAVADAIVAKYRQQT
jgi:hypothetical protein